MINSDMRSGLFVIAFLFVTACGYLQPRRVLARESRAA